MVKCKYFQLSLDKGTEESEWRESFKKKKKKGEKILDQLISIPPPKNLCKNFTPVQILAQKWSQL